MKRIFIFTFALFISLSLSAQDNTIRLTVSGEGATKEEATANALRSAIEQAFGTFVSANTQILNDDIVKDEIATISSGNIQEYSELGCITMPDGHKSVSLSATVSIGNLISYAKSKGSSAEFAGAVFAMNMKMRKLNAENEKKAVEHLRNQLEILAPDLFKIEISITESPIRKHMSGYDFNTLKALNFSVVPDANYYLIPIKFNYYSSETSKAFHSVLLNTLQSLALSQSEIEEYRNSDEHIYTYHPDTWKKLGLGGLDLAFRTSFIPDLISFLDRVYRVALFCSYNLDIVGLNESHRFYNYSSRIQLDGRPIYDKEEGTWEYNVKFEDYYGRPTLDFSKFNTINSLVKTEKINVLFTEEEIEKVTGFEMNKNDDDLLHSITLYDTGYKAYKAFMQHQHAFTFKKHSNQIEFVSPRYKKNGQTFNEPTRIVFDLKSGGWDFGILGSIKESFYSSYHEKLNFKYGGGSSYYDILLEQYSNSDNYYLYVERLGEDKSEYYFHIPNKTTSDRTSNDWIKYLDDFYNSPKERSWQEFVSDQYCNYGEYRKWSDWEWDETKIQIAAEESTIYLKGAIEEEVEVLGSNGWTIDANGWNVLTLTCKNEVKMSLRKKDTERQIYIYHYNENGFESANGLALEKNITISIVKDGYRIYPYSGGNYIFFKISNQPDCYGLSKFEGECPICIIPQFDSFYSQNPRFSDNMIIASKRGKWGAIDFMTAKHLDGTYIIPFRYDEMMPFSEGKAEATFNGNQIFVKASEKEFVSYDVLNQNNATGNSEETLMRKGISIIPYYYGMLIAFRKNGKIGFALNSSEANVLVAPRFEEICHEDIANLIPVKENGKWGALRPISCEIVIPCIYDSMTSFKDGVSTVSQNGITFKINEKGEKVI